MIALIRWVAFIVLAITAALAFDGMRAWLLALVMAVAVLAIIATFGGFRREVWFGTPEQDAACSAADEYLDQLEEIARHEARQEERHRRLHS